MHKLMGKVVLVHKILRRFGSGDGLRSWESWKVEGRPGWVTGERWLPVGSVERDCDYRNTWVQSKEYSPTHCLLVSYWSTMNPVKVPDDGYELALPTIYPYQTPQPWPQSHRDYMRKEMAEWPRDEKGRWVRKEK